MTSMTLFHMKTVHAATLALTVLLASCAAPVHVPPTTGPTAELIVARTEGNTAPILHVHLYKETRSCFGLSSLEPIDFDSSERRRTTVTANRPLALAIGEYNRQVRTTCSITFEFDPVKDARYLATWSSGANGCYVRLGRITSMGGIEHVVPEPSMRPHSSGCTGP